MDFSNDEVSDVGSYGQSEDQEESDGQEGSAELPVGYGYVSYLTGGLSDYDSY